MSSWVFIFPRKYKRFRRVIVAGSFFWTGLFCLFVNIPLGHPPRRKVPPVFLRENHGDEAQLRELVFGCPIGQGISLWHQNLEWGQGEPLALRNHNQSFRWELLAGISACRVACRTQGNGPSTL